MGKQNFWKVKSLQFEKSWQKEATKTEIGASSSLGKEARDFAERQIQLKYESQRALSASRSKESIQPARMHKSKSWTSQSGAAGFDLVAFGKSTSFSGLRVQQKSNLLPPLSLPVEVDGGSELSPVPVSRGTRRARLDSLRIREFLPSSKKSTNLKLVQG